MTRKKLARDLERMQEAIRATADTRAILQRACGELNDELWQALARCGKRKGWTGHCECVACTTARACMEANARAVELALLEERRIAEKWDGAGPAKARLAH